MKRGVISIVVVGVTVAALGCGGGQPADKAGGPLRVVATTTIVGDLARSVGGDDIELTTLMGAGVDPHLYKPSAGDVRAMASAEVVVYNGLHLEGKMTEVLAEMGTRGVETVAVAECVPVDSLLPVEGYDTLHDPHVWFDVELWQRAAACLRDELMRIDPEHSDGYRQRGDAVIAELAELHGWVAERVASLPEKRRVLVTAHDAFSYFGRAYGLEVRGLLGVSTSAEAGTADVQDLAAFIADRGLPAVFVESSVSPRYVEALTEAVAARGGAVAIGGSVYSDALGSPGSAAETYVGTVRSNVETIVEALASEPDASAGGAS
jgi:manganese/zinc/iron transport system substrate-binding protein